MKLDIKITPDGYLHIGIPCEEVKSRQFSITFSRDGIRENEVPQPAQLYGLNDPHNPQGLDEPHNPEGVKPENIPAGWRIMTQREKLARVQKYSSERVRTLVRGKWQRWDGFCQSTCTCITDLTPEDLANLP